MTTYFGKDNCTDTILDFIIGGPIGDELGNRIGESDGNYNAYFGHVHGAYDFSTYTLARIYGFQSQMLQNDPRSTAIGAYQFLRGTLQKLATKKALPNTTLFTPKFQDEMAVELLKGRGYQAWWRGAISDEEFAHNLSMEWASLPDPDNGGRSHYDGDSAGNHASTTVENFLHAIAVARTRMPA